LKGREFLLWNNIRNENGALFPLAIVLLFLITGACLAYAFSFQMEIKIYNSLELSNVHATIDILQILISEN
jgi:hypothetical protein